MKGRNGRVLCHNLPLPQLREPSHNWGHYSLWSRYGLWSRDDLPYYSVTLCCRPRETRKHSLLKGKSACVHERKNSDSEDTLFCTRRKGNSPCFIVMNLNVSYSVKNIRLWLSIIFLFLTMNSFTQNINSDLLYHIFLKNI